jgi:hypothetical protein
MKSLADPDIRISAVERLKTVQADSPARWGKMNAHQMVCHLSDSFRLALRERTASPATGFFQRTIVKWIALYLPAPWPKGLPTRPEMEQGAGGTPPDAFAEDRRGLVVLIERFSRSDTSFEGVQHPLFGEMSKAEWLRWGWLHVDHHLRQFGA